MRISLSFWLCSVLSVLLAVAGLVLASHYPVAPAAATMVFIVVSVLFYVKPRLWLLLLPALLPVIGFAPWTGWITFEELDMLVLAAGTAGYASMANTLLANPDGTACAPHKGQSTAVLPWILVILFAASVVVATLRGGANAGGFNFGWYQGYLESMNSIRLGKTYFEVLLLAPLWLNAQRLDPESAQRLLSTGLMVGLAGAALGTVWERAAFTGLMNFSSDYRTTGLFWEMHVGGAALDGFLALTVPFAMRELLVARTTLRWGMAAVVTAMAAYACLTTFSRGLYLAMPVGLIVFMVLSIRQRSFVATTNSAVGIGTNRDAGHGMAIPSAVLLLVGFGCGAAWIFQTSGYRGMAAWLAMVGLMLPMARVMGGYDLKKWLVACVLAVLAVLLASAITWLMPKGAYVAWVIGVGLTLALLARLRLGKRRSVIAEVLAFAGFTTAAASVVLVANHWGGAAGVSHAAPVLVVGLCVTLAAGVMPWPAWPDSLRWQATMAASMAIVAVALGIFGGGAYMSERFATGRKDVENRMTHWRLGRDMIHGDVNMLLGVGMGRFPANYFLAGNPQQHPGDYRIKQEQDNTYLTLSGGLHLIGWGEFLRVSQRVPELGIRPVLTARVRASNDVGIHFEVCEKHLLYNANCVLGKAAVKGARGVWQTVQVEFKGGTVARGNWFAPRLLTFSMAMESGGGIADLDDVALTDGGGHSMLANGDFSDGGAHWFSSSDRHHLPWHVKNVLLNVLFEQGVVGAGLWCLMVAAAIWRTSLGRASSQPLAPAIAAGLVGFVVVGLFDSLLDAPRLAWTFYLLVVVALLLPGRGRLQHSFIGTRIAAGMVLTIAVCGSGLAPEPVLAVEGEVAKQAIG